MIVESFSAKETEIIGCRMGRAARPGQVYCLSGDLGTGKTVFTRGFAQGLGITGDITSPTFSIINCHEGPISFYHLDVYRISSLEEMEDTGYEDYFYGNGVCLVEWGEIIEELLPLDRIVVTIEKNLAKGLDYRKITIQNDTGGERDDTGH